MLVSRPLLQKLQIFKFLRYHCILYRLQSQDFFYANVNKKKTHHLWLHSTLLLLLFSRPVMRESLQCYGLQHARSPCPSPSPKVCPNSCPLHWWYHPTISSSDALFSFCPQSFPASGTFTMSQLFTLDDQNAGVSTSESVLPMSIQGWFSLRLTDLISGL